MHTHRYTLDLDARPDVLPRVVNLVRRRGCEIVSLQFAQGDCHRPGRLELAVRVDERHARPMAHWLGALVDVRSVAEV